MFNTIRFKPGSFRQLSLYPKYYFGNNTIYVHSNYILTQDEVLEACSFKIETGARAVVQYNPSSGTETTISSDEPCTIITKYFPQVSNNLTIYHYDNIFVVTKVIRGGVTLVEVAGCNRSALLASMFDNEVDVKEEKMVDSIDTVSNLLDFIAENC